MNWSRAKTILIASFLLLNMILGFQLWSTNRSNQGTSLDPSSTVEDLNRALRNKNIRLTDELPTDSPKLKVITVKYDDSIKLGEVKKLKSPIYMSTLLGKGASKEAQSLSEIPNFAMYQLDSVMSQNGIYVFSQLYGKVPLFDVTVELKENNGEITSYRQAFVEVESEVEQTEQKLISAQLAVRSLVDNYLSDGSIITEVRLGYHGQPYNSQTQPMFPQWRITIDNGYVYYVQAFNGAVESLQKGSEPVPFESEGGVASPSPGDKSTPKK
ncbi:two-component system regulatory protein YycI [Paenibacillus qinlingensis]|uniref:Regulatory protein YycI of two-component signal transduction system YycFG n=1 Tax=Paenibacillus qinlingensis TaxID=1837343 RepID=A0ABU1NXW9_9BACL|nr:two-component system regulatory protein YycI [Paenibacillus qinlingensis]MDR6552357.1 regulatory protein YycI of two-component signal transduction system YycFG [Paenibacillus qinlingensis]